MPVRFEPELQQLLREGARRTPHKKQELIRITLRRYLPKVIEQEAGKRSRGRLTRLEPWSRSTLEKAYRQIGSEWDALEEAAIKAQGRPDFND
jgi:CRISPR/Cas system-associated protein Csm6